MKKRQDIDRRYARQAIIATLCLWGLGYGLLMAFMAATRAVESVPEALAQGANLIIGVLLTIIIYKVLAASQNENSWLRYLGVTIVILVLALLQSTFDLTLLRFYDLHFFNNQADWDGVTVWDRVPRMTFLYTWIYALNASFFVLILNNRRMVEQTMALSAAQGAARQAQLDALRHQLNPHFLFNVLNALSTLVVLGRNQEADEIINKLSDFLRASLVSEGASAVPLDEELETLTTYLDIERLRFPDRLIVEIDCPTELLDACTPSFILQPLVENAIKYAVAPALRPVTITLTARRNGDDLVLCVKDDGDGCNAPSRKGTGVGLNNIRNRLQTLFGDRASLATTATAQGYTAQIRLPLSYAAQNA